MKRLRTDKLQDNLRQMRPETDDDGAIEALLSLTTGSWNVESVTQKQKETRGASKPRSKTAAEVAPSKGARNVAKVPKTSYSTRSYVWRGPHRGALALKKFGWLSEEQQQQLSYSLNFQGLVAQQQQEQQISLSDANSSRRSSASGAGPSDDEEVAQQQQQQQHNSSLTAARDGGRDKEWAALTTWLRMNLHHPRTAKKLVLFVGHQDEASGSWTFSLNPGLTWDDVSLETKLRLKTLPLEAEQAFCHKYPERPSCEWCSKVQKYRPPGSSSTVNVCLLDMVKSLNNIYYQHEPDAATCLPVDCSVHAQQQMYLQLQQHSCLPAMQPAVAAAVAAAAATAAAFAYGSGDATAAAAITPGGDNLQLQAQAGSSIQQQQQQQQQQHLQHAPASQVPPSSLLLSVTGTGAAAAAAAAAADDDDASAHVAAAAAANGTAAGMSSMQQVKLSMAVDSSLTHQQPLSISRLQMLHGAAGAGTVDGADSCTESATPVAARTTELVAS